jgi:hypothetical protein
MDDKLLRDEELDRLLEMASKPLPSGGHQQRVLSRITPSATNVIAFPKRKRPSPWIIGLPLAASLALGLWLGSAGLGSSYLSPNTTLVSDSTDDAGDTGFDDVAAFLDGSLT